MNGPLFLLRLRQSAARVPALAGKFHNVRTFCVLAVLTAITAVITNRTYTSVVPAFVIVVGHLIFSLERKFCCRPRQTRGSTPMVAV
jgi:hypothetical protein